MWDLDTIREDVFVKDYFNFSRKYKSNKDNFKLAYICSPFSGNVKKNVENTRMFCEYVVKIRGLIPIAPHLLFPQFLKDNNPNERELALRMNMELISKCDEFYVFGFRITNGMRKEIAKASELGIQISYISIKEVKSEGF